MAHYTGYKNAKLHCNNNLEKKKTTNSKGPSQKQKNKQGLVGRTYDA
jgi:hypothetical protein